MQLRIMTVKILYDDSTVEQEDLERALEEAVGTVDGHLCSVIDCRNDEARVEISD